MNESNSELASPMTGLDQDREETPDIPPNPNLAAKLALKEIDSDIKKVQPDGEAGQAVITQLKGLMNEVKEKQASFDDRQERLSSPYVLSPELERVLNTSRLLHRPLLLEGEPGTGKTALAYAISGHEGLPIIHAQCKSTTTAQDLLYSFDVVKRLQDAQLGKDVTDARQYVILGPIGQAFASNRPVILLIDEIDKAKREFGNDLLHELDQLSFFVKETGEEITSKYKPIVIITSNHERDLPEAVLRRIVYHYIDFPTPEQMTEIVKAHIPNVNEQLLPDAIQKFYQVRETPRLEKKPSTSEMLDWIKILSEFSITDVGSDIPYPETLLKYKDDIDLVIGVKKEREQQLREANMPEAVIAALAGDKVIRIKPGSTWDNNCPDKSIYTLLANEGYLFVTQNYNRSFDIREAGVRLVGPLTFALSKSETGEDHDLYNLLKDNNLIKSEFVTFDPDTINPEFGDIEESNDFFMAGKLADGYKFYQTQDGQFVFEVAPSNPK